MKQAYDKFEFVKSFKDIDEITEKLVRSSRPETNEFINNLLKNQEEL